MPPTTMVLTTSGTLFCSGFCFPFEVLGRDGTCSSPFARALPRSLSREQTGHHSHESRELPGSAGGLPWRSRVNGSTSSCHFLLLSNVLCRPVLYRSVLYRPQGTPGTGQGLQSGKGDKFQIICKQSLPVSMRECAHM